MKSLLFVMILLFTACGNNETQNAHARHLNSNNVDLVESEKIMSLMHAAMMTTAYQTSDNPDADFLVNMIPHHQGAIDSSREFLTLTSNTQLATIASNIIAAQESEIDIYNDVLEEMEGTIARYPQADFNAMQNNSQVAMTSMMTAMTSLPLTGNIDVDFAEGMIIHHQGAVEVARSMQSTTNTQIRLLASGIISSQESEIAELRAIVEALTNAN